MVPWSVFENSENLRFISHLDLSRTWERALRRAGIPIAYSRGFHPHPKMVFAAALPLGCTGEAEVMVSEVTLADGAHLVEIDGLALREIVAILRAFLGHKWFGDDPRRDEHDDFIAIDALSRLPKKPAHVGNVSQVGQLRAAG